MNISIDISVYIEKIQKFMIITLFKNDNIQVLLDIILDKVNLKSDVHKEFYHIILQYQDLDTKEVINYIPNYQYDIIGKLILKESNTFNGNLLIKLIDVIYYPTLYSRYMIHNDDKQIPLLDGALLTSSITNQSPSQINSYNETSINTDHCIEWISDIKSYPIQSHQVTEIESIISQQINSISFIDSLFNELSCSSYTVMQGLLNRKISSYHKNQEKWKESYFLLDILSNRLWYFTASNHGNNCMIPSFIQINQGGNVDLKAMIQINRLDSTTFTLIIKDNWYIHKQNDITNHLNNEIRRITLKAKDIYLTDEWIMNISKHYISDYPFPSYREISLYVELLHIYTNKDNDQSITEITLDLLMNNNSKFHQSNYDLIDELHSLSMCDCDIDVNSKLMNIELDIQDSQEHQSNIDINLLLSVSSFDGLWKSSHVREAFIEYMNDKFEINTFLFWQYTDDYMKGHPNSEYNSFQSKEIISDRKMLLTWINNIYNVFLNSNNNNSNYQIKAIWIQSLSNELLLLYKHIKDLETNLLLIQPSIDIFTVFHNKAYCFIRDCYHRHFKNLPEYISILKSSCCIDKKIEINNNEIEKVINSSTSLSSKNVLNGLLSRISFMNKNVHTIQNNKNNEYTDPQTSIKLIPTWRINIIKQLTIIPLDNIWWQLWNEIESRTIDNNFAIDNDNNDNNNDNNNNNKAIIEKVKTFNIIQQHLQLLFEKQIKKENELRLLNFDLSLNTGNASNMYKYDIPNHIKKVILHKARLCTTNFNAFQPTSIGNNGIKILCAYIKCKLHMITKRKSIDYRRNNNSNTPSPIEHSRRVMNADVPYHHSYLDSIILQELIQSEHEDNMKMITNDWNLFNAILFVNMGNLYIYLYDPHTHIHIFTIHLDRIVLITPSMDELYTIELYDKLKTRIQILFISTDPDDQLLQTQQWLWHFSSFCLPSIEIIHILKCGYLYKRGKRNTAFKLRWFVLCTDFRLIYYKDNSKGKYKGVIDLSSADIMNHKTIAIQNEKEIIISMNAIQRTWILLAENNDTATEWINSMNDLVLSIPPQNRISSYNCHSNYNNNNNNNNNNNIEDDEEEDIDDI